MRAINAVDRDDAERQLNAEEVLVPSGGITLLRGVFEGEGYFVPFFTAFNIEDFEHHKETKLYQRRKRRRAKARERHND